MGGIRWRDWAVSGSDPGGSGNVTKEVFSNEWRSAQTSEQLRFETIDQRHAESALELVLSGYERRNGRMCLRFLLGLISETH